MADVPRHWADSFVAVVRELSGVLPLNFAGLLGAKGKGRVVAQDDLVLTPTGLRFRGHRYPCTIGTGGITANKREGDGATPVGVHRIVGMFYRPDRLARPASWAEPIHPNDLWSDDADQLDYNHLVQKPYAYSHEVMRRSDPLYDLVMITDWNWPVAQPGAGSCIFIHQWRRPGFPTAGCVAFRRDHLHQIARQVQPGTRLIVRAG